MQKLADYIGEFFLKKKLTAVFVVSGGASLHLIHGFEKQKKIKIVCCHHEQACAMAADGYSRISGQTGVALATSGPGATNLITGIAGCFYDSVPAIFITGQVSTFRQSKNPKIRQFGFQETPIIPMCEKIVKYAVQIKNPLNIKYELEKSLYIANEGRPGPVLIDIPDNIQRELIDVSSLDSFSSNLIKSKLKKVSPNIIKKIINKLISSKRPVIIAGWGIHLTKTEEQFLSLINQLKIPVALTWGAADLIEEKNILKVGTFGTHGNRFTNFTVQNADFILSLGCRLDTKATGSPPETFAKSAWKTIVDIDLDELKKYDKSNLNIDCKVNSDLRDFLPIFMNHCLKVKDKIPNFESWINKIYIWKQKYNPLFESK